MTDEKDDKEKKSEAEAEKEPAETKAETKAAEKKPKAEKKKKEKDPADAYRLAPSNPVANAWKTFAGMGLVGIIGSVVGYSQDHDRFAYSWLFGFICVLSLVIGAILLVLMHHMANAHWGIVVRRVCEVFGASAWVLLILMIPVFLTRNTLFGEFLDGGREHAAAKEHAALDLPQDDLRLAANDWEQPHGLPPHGGGMRFQPRGGGARPTPPPGGVRGTPIHVRAGSDAEARAERVEHQEVMASKRWYLSPGFFYGRIAFYFLCWIGVGWWLLKRSLDQDKSKDKMITVSLARGSAPALILMAISLTFAAFDWVMALDPTWYSTIFGVTFFAGSMVCIFAILILTFLGMRQSGVLVKEVTVEHYHDLGKLLFGFMCFWAYVCFAQFFLDWYATIPEEVTFYHHRWDIGWWRNVSLAIIFLHFIFPFIFIMSRNVKRNLQLLKFGAGLLLTMHVVDIYWLVMPNAPHQTSFWFSWIDLFGFMGPVGVFLAYAFRKLQDHPLLPIGDPRLERSIHFLNA